MCGALTDTAVRGEGHGMLEGEKWTAVTYAAVRVPRLQLPRSSHLGPFGRRSKNPVPPAEVVLSEELFPIFGREQEVVLIFVLLLILLS